jgi:hypothetical protein
MNLSSDLLYSIRDEAEPAIREKGKDKGKRCKRVVKIKELEKIDS